MRNIGVVTVARSDYCICLPVLRAIEAEPSLRLNLIVAGMHLSSEFGQSSSANEADGFEISDRVDMLLSSDAPEGTAKSMGLGTLGFAQAYVRSRPDILPIVGDRFETHAAVVATLPFRIPVAHIHGSEITEGAIDDALRHSITKLSHMHFVGTEEYPRRVLKLGEEAWRVVVSGATSLDNFYKIKLLDRWALDARSGLRLDRDPILVTYHPVTLEPEQADWQVHELLGALRYCDYPVVFTMPNADGNGCVIPRRLEEFVKNSSHAQMVDNLETHAYFSLMSCAVAMVGNSSSGIIEAPSLGLPVVNIGTRQQNRTRAENVIDVGYGQDEIIEGIKKAVEPDFREYIRGRPNPNGNGHASEVILKHLSNVPLDDRLLRKRFVDMRQSPDPGDPTFSLSAAA